MAVPNDPAPALQAYAHPEKLVTTEWLAANLDTPGLVVVESDEDVLLYETGHIPGAVKVDWHLTDRNGTYKISDVMVDGISMAVTQRSEFASVIQRSGGHV